MSAERPLSINAAVENLFGPERVPGDLALHLLSAWNSNLEATERRVDRAFLAAFALFISFLALDTGLLTKLTFQGAELQRTGLVLCTVPVAIAYCYYRYSTQISFAHDLRTAIAVMYRHLYSPVYLGGLDLLTHVPSVRNLEAYDSFFAPPRLRVFHERTTDAVTILLLLGPLAAIVYCIVRLWSYPDVSITTWAITALMSLVFLVRAWFYGLRTLHDDAFAVRRHELPSDRPPQPDVPSAVGMG
jgi:hypothetical protein